MEPNAFERLYVMASWSPPSGRIASAAAWICSRAAVSDSSPSMAAPPNAAISPTSTAPAPKPLATFSKKLMSSSALVPYLASLTAACASRRACWSRSSSSSLAIWSATALASSAFEIPAGPSTSYVAPSDPTTSYTAMLRTYDFFLTLRCPKSLWTRCIFSCIGLS